MLRIGILLLLSISCTSIYKSDLSKLNNQSPLRMAHYESLPRQTITFSVEGLPNRVPMSAQAVFPVIEALLEKGPSGMKETDYRKQLFLMNADISFSTQYRASYLSVTAPPENLDRAVNLALKTFQNPKFNRSDIQQALRQTKANITAEFSEMRSVILYYAFKDYFDFDPMVRNGSTSPNNIKNLKWAKVESLYNKFIQLDPLRFYTTGPMSRDQVAKIIEKQSLLVGDSYKPYNFEERSLNKPEQIQVTLIHRKGVTDHQVLFVYPYSIIPASQDGINASLMFEVLGGGLTGKLGSTLREERGLTYHVSANYGRFLPVWYVYSFAGNQQIQGLLEGIVEVKNKFKNQKVNKHDIEMAKQSLITSHKRATELPVDSLYREMYYDLFNYDLDYFYNYENHIKSVDQASVEKVKNKILSQDKFHLYLMGDKNILIPVLRSIGWDKVVEIVEESKI